MSTLRDRELDDRVLSKQYQHPEALAADERRWRDYIIHRFNQLEALHMGTNATLTDLDNSLTNIETAVAALPALITTQADDLTTLVKDISTKLSAFGTAPNFITEVNRANAIVANLKGIASTISANTTEVTTEDTTVNEPAAPVLAVTAISLTTEANPTVNVGDTAEFDVVVEESPVGAVPTGTVIISDQTGTSVASITLDQTGSGKASVVMTTPGTFSYVAQYSGDAANSPSTSAPLSFSVVAPASTVTGDASTTDTTQTDTSAQTTQTQS